MKGYYMNKVAFFDTKPYDKIYFDKLKDQYGIEIEYFESKLSPRTAVMARGSKAVVAFVNDDISKETIVNNGLHKMRGALEIFPRRCVTLGMKQLLKAKVLKVYLYCDWQWGIARKISLQDESRFMPVSFLQSHENSEMVVTKDLFEFML